MIPTLRSRACCVLLSASVVLFAALFEIAAAATSVTRFAITWTFSQDRPVGQYANGDWWVVGPVTITNITPKSVDSGGRTINGSVINPSSAKFPNHGFDSLMAGTGLGYNSSLNVGRPGGNDISASNPLAVANGSSLVSCVSHADPNNRPTITDVSILTVVSSAPASGAFRPPYCGSDKTHYWNKSNLNYSILQKLSLSGAPTPDSMAASFVRPWFELATESSGRYYHPANHQPEYGRDMAWILGDALLTLHLNYTDAQKETLYVRIVQWGIDLYGCAKTGALWSDNGGHNAGRKGGLVMAGLALNDPNILAYANAKNTSPNGFIFAEDRQTWYVTQSDVGRPLYHDDGRLREEYIQADVGIPEWGEKHASQPTRDGRNWSAYYRDINYIAHLGEALAIRLTAGGYEAWNWPAFFDYTDRSWSVSSSAMRAFPAAMWSAYRGTGNTPPVIPPPATFAIGDRIQTTKSTNVRATGTLSGTLLGVQALGALGTIVAGPVEADGITWWQVNYDTGADGWSGGDNFIKSTDTSTPPPSAPTGLRIDGN